MDITLHLGAHRTAATTLQRFLSGNAPALAAAGLAVWTPAQMRAGKLSRLVRRPDQVTLVDEVVGRRSIGAMQLAQARLERAGTSRLLVSEQHLLGTLRNNVSQRRLYPWAGERLARVAPALEAYCDRMVLAIRGYERYWTSVLAEAIMMGHPLPDAALLDRLVTQPRRWRHVIEEVSRVMPRADLIVWPHEALAGQPERQLGLMAGAPLPAGRAGRMQGARDWWRAAPSPEEICGRLADAGEFSMLPLSGSHRWQPFDADQRAALDGQYAEDLAWLRDGADGHATLAQCAEAKDLRIPGRTGGCTPDDRQDASTGMG